MPVASNALREARSLSDVDDLPLHIREEVDARSVREHLQRGGDRLGDHRVLGVRTTRRSCAIGGASVQDAQHIIERLTKCNGEV